MTTKRDEIEEGDSYCHNPPCNCVIPAGAEYCEEYCRLEDTEPSSEYAEQQDIERGVGCRCGHSECQS
jgi:hypothetical protein